MRLIPPLHLAQKLKAIRDGEQPALSAEIEAQPRLLELLWFVQYLSMQPAGLQRFAESFMARFSPRFRPVKRHDSYFDPVLDGIGGMRGRVRLYSAQECGDRTASCLAQLLSDMCIVAHQRLSSPWFCPDLIPWLLETMERHRTARLLQIADTAIIREMFEMLNFARKHKEAVVIVGRSSYGKTTALKAYCESQPGAARLVEVPAANRERRFIQEYAKALGLGFTEATSTPTLFEQVEFILEQSHLFIPLDEAQYLFEGTARQVTIKRRLDWVRKAVMNQGIGTAAVATAEDYNASLTRYAKQTGDKLIQWQSRTSEPRVLTEEWSEQELMAVAEKKFPDIEQPLLKVICGLAMNSKGYLRYITKVAEWSQFLAEERNAPRVELQDVESAIRRWGPNSMESALAPVLQPRRKGSAKPVQERGGCGRELQPGGPVRGNFEPIPSGYGRDVGTVLCSPALDV